MALSKVLILSSLVQMVLSNNVLMLLFRGQRYTFFLIYTTPCQNKHANSPPKGTPQINADPIPSLYRDYTEPLIGY